MPVTLPVNIKTYMVSNSPQIKVLYPQVYDLRDLRFEKYMNRLIVDEVQKQINQQAGNLPSTIAEMLGTFEIKNNQRNILSLTLSNYTYHDKAAHGLTLLNALTFDLENKKRCELSDLFQPGSNYVKKLSELVQQQITQRNIQPLQPFTQIKPNQDFYLADKTLVLYFQLYELTYYAYGFPMFPISIYEIQDIIKENGPLGRLEAGV